MSLSQVPAWLCRAQVVGGGACPTGAVVPLHHYIDVRFDEAARRFSDERDASREATRLAFEALKMKLEATHDDQESTASRLASLEKAHAKLLGIFVVLALLIPVAAVVVVKMIGK